MRAIVRTMLEPHHRKQIIALADCNPRTLARVYAGQPVHAASYRAIYQAAESIGAALPPAWVRAVVGRRATEAKEHHAS